MKNPYTFIKVMCAIAMGLVTCLVPEPAIAHINNPGFKTSGTERADRHGTGIVNTGETILKWAIQPANNAGEAISGANAATYSLSAGLTATNTYRRYAKDGSSNTTPEQLAGEWPIEVTKVTNYLFAWGNNANGQLGDGSTSNKNIPTQIGTATDWKIVAGGAYHTLAIRNDGTLWAWGYNNYGQLGDGTTNSQNTPKQIGTATDWKAVAGGYYHSLAIRNDGTLWAWGGNFFSQLGDGTYIHRTSPTQIGSSADWKAVAAGYYHSLAIRNDGTLWAWGDNYNGQLGNGTYTELTSPTQIGTATDWKAVVGGYQHSLAIRNDGTLWAWGYNYNGQLGDGTTTTKTTPTQIGTATDWKAVAAGTVHSLAIRNDGTLWAWGDNTFGQLGIGSTTNQNTPAQIGTETDWKAFATGIYHSLAIKNDGTLWAWGYNYNGQLGDGTTTNKNIPTQIGTSTDWNAVATGNHSLAFKGSPICDNPTQGGVIASNQTVCYNTAPTAFTSTSLPTGHNGTLEYKWQLTTSDPSASGFDPASWVDIASSNAETYQAGALTQTTWFRRLARVECSADWSGAVASNTLEITVRPQFTAGAIATIGETISYAGTPAQIGSITEASGGDGNITYSWRSSADNYTAAISGANAATYTPPSGLTVTTTYRRYAKDGSCNTTPEQSAGEWTIQVTQPTNYLFAWGYNYFGQLGDGTTINKSSPIQIGTANDWKMVSAGENHTLAIRNDGTLWAWGYNGYGQLGDGTTAGKTSPTQIGTATNWKAVAAGIYHSLAIRTDGTLWVWGNNAFGQLGDGTQVEKYSPVQIGTATDWKVVATISYHSLAIRNDGTLWAWGYNQYGQVGNGTDNNNVYTPTQIGTATNWKTVVAGRVHSLAIRNDGTLWAWGRNTYGQLGIGSTTNQNTPTQIGSATNWKTIAAGGYHSLAIMNDGTQWAWGYNYYGQLGDGSTINRYTPTQIGTATNWKAVAAGTNHSMAIRNDGTLWAWGHNPYGQLGDGTTANKNIPTQIGTSTDWNAVAANGLHSLAFKNSPICDNPTQGGVIASNQTVCYNTAPAAFTSTSLPTGHNGTLEYKWQSTTSDPSASGFDPASWVDIASSNAETYQAGALTQTTWFRRLARVECSADWSGAAASNSLEITVRPQFTAGAIATTGQIICYNTDPETIGNVTAASGGDNAIAYKWQSSADGNEWSDITDSNAATYDPSNLTSTTHYRRLAKDGTCNTFTASAGIWIVTVRPQFTAGAIATIGETISYLDTPAEIGSITAASGGDDNITYSWRSSADNYTAAVPGANGATYTPPSGLTVTTTYRRYAKDGSCNTTPEQSAGEWTIQIIQLTNYLLSWGNNPNGQLGDGTQVDKTSPIQIGTSTDWKVISVAGNYSLAIRNDGTLWAWGQNLFGQHGDGTTVDKTTPTQIGTATNWKTIAAGTYHVLAIRDDGTLWAWGYNGSGQLGDGTYSDKTTPTQIGSATDWKAVAVGSMHSLAIKNDGTIWTWGSNIYGQLGDGTYIFKTSPTQIGTVTDWKAVFAGAYYSLAIRNDGTLWAWGRNQYGQLGDGTTVDKTSPTQIGSATNWKTIAAAAFHTLAIRNDGTLWAWGYNGYGQLGDGTTAGKTSPTQIGTATNWKAVAAGIYHSLAIRTDGTLRAWGYNGYGQLGDGTTANKTSPTQIGTATDWNAVSTGLYHAVAFKNSPICENPTQGGELASDQTICYNTAPAAFTSTSLPTGYIGTLEYKWQSTTSDPSASGFDPASWVDIASSNAETYQAGALTQTTWFRRLARVECSADWSGAVASNTLEITVHPQFTAGAIATTGQTICFNEDPSVISSITAASGGDNAIAYKWQSSPDGNDWSDIAGSNAATYDPSNLTSTTHYRRLAKDGTCNTFTASTGVWVITVNQPSRRYVTVSGAGLKTGLDWANAYDGTQLQSAINESCVNEVWVARGYYYPNVEVGGTGERYRTFQMKNGVAIYGGFEGNESQVSDRTDFGINGANETVLSGSLATKAPSSNCYHIFYHPAGLNLNATAILDGFTIRDGYADGPGNHYIGGGMYNYGSSPSLNNIRFINNYAYAAGALYLYNSSSTINNTIFSENTADFGGAIYIQGNSSPIFTNTMISNNIANEQGGGVYWVSSGNPVFNNATFANNIAAARGGAIYLYGQSTGILTLRNSILWGNQANAPTYPGKQVYWYSGYIHLKHTCYASGADNMQLTVGFYDIDSYCITTDPQFVDASNKDFRIKGISPCADAGNDSYNTLLTDIRGMGFGRKLLKSNYTQSGVIDMGAYEYNSNTDPMGCANPSAGGTIAAFQTICYNTAPAAFTSTSLPTGHNGTLEYKWQSTASDPSASGFDPASWVDIASSNAATYEAGALTQTTWFRRLARVECAPDWTGAEASNTLEITVRPQFTA
ncbi:MAG TPA: hypothetical protein PKE03_11300, partial [Bacteroidales bacterium]|nr:hypothetical protein [Bacteroidales bacterium]